MQDKRKAVVAELTDLRDLVKKVSAFSIDYVVVEVLSQQAQTLYPQTSTLPMSTSDS